MNGLTEAWMESDGLLQALIMPWYSCEPNPKTEMPLGGRDFCLDTRGYSYDADYLDYLEADGIGVQEL